MTDRLSIILLNFHGAEDTIACLESLRRAQLGEAQVILLENGSGQTDIDRLALWNRGTQFFGHTGLLPETPNGGALPRVHSMLVSKTNLGFAGGNNKAVEFAQACGSTEVLLLNNDTEVEPHFLEELAAARRRHPSAVLIPQIRLHGRPDKVWNCGGRLIWPGRKSYHYGNEPITTIPPNADLPISFVTGCALLYQPAVTGHLTERFFFGEEDMEFSWRLETRSIPMFCVTAAVIYHKVGATLADNFRKSEIFTLKRLINLRINKDGLEVAAGYVYTLVNLFRLLVTRYGKGLFAAASSVKTVYRASLDLQSVGEGLCVAYVRSPSLSLAAYLRENPARLEVDVETLRKSSNPR